MKKNPTTKLPPARGIKLSAWALNASLAALSFLMLVPILIAFSTAIKAPGETQMNPGLIPQQIEFGKFLEVGKEVNVPLLALNSTVIALGTIALLLLLSSMAAYAFARVDFIGKDAFYMLFLAGLMIPGAGLIVPLYQLNVTFRLMNTYLGVIGPYVALGLPFGILILRGFFESLPSELEDAARVDGASRFTVYWRILLPLTKPGLVTVAVFQGLAAWNDFLLPMLFLTKPQMRTMPLGLIVFETLYFVRWEHQFALVVMMTLPVLILFLAAQRQFIGGLTAGAVRG